MSIPLEKHKKYKNSYGKNELYWGLGIEEETYLQFSKPIYVASSIIKSCHKAERYSVRYFSNYKPFYTKELEFNFTKPFYPLPFFFNAHAFLKMDVKNQHKTTYEKNPKPNTNFSGQTFFEELQSWKPEYFVTEYEKSFLFDGDTLEFMTQNFYKAKAKDVIGELVNYKKQFLTFLNEFCKQKKLHSEKGEFIYPPINPGLVVHFSNPGNISVFNNGTYHINITLPTFLDDSGAINKPELFREIHQKYIRLVQWLQPFLVAEFGTSDPFSEQSERYSKSSQRVAVSRYISLGTFDTELMSEGKCNTLPITNISGTDSEFWWYKLYHKLSGYVPLDIVGLDINYKKHFSHGCEFRFFDWFPESELYRLTEALVYIAVCSQNIPLTPVPIKSESWNEFVIGVMVDGQDYKIPLHIRALYEKILQVELYDFKDLTAKGLFRHILKNLKKKYENDFLTKCFLSK